MIDVFAEPLEHLDPRRAAFREGIALAWAGRVAPSSLADEARALGLDGPLTSGEPAPAVRQAPTEDELARIAGDHDPTVAAAALDRVLGPWADEADPRSRLYAAAAGAALVPDDATDTPLHRELRRCHRDQREGLRAVLRAPFAPYAVDGERWVPLLRVAPAGPVRSAPIATPAGSSVAAVFARVLPLADGARAVGAIAVPRALVDLERRLRLLTWEERLHRPCGTLELLLARRGHVLLRRSLEEAW